jgi:hypothetical protein
VPVAKPVEEMSVAVLHYDSDLGLTSEVTGRSSQWVVPAGTVD